jgi:hypothetical protein
MIVLVYCTCYDLRCYITIWTFCNCQTKLIPKADIYTPCFSSLLDYFDYGRCADIYPACSMEISRFFLASMKIRD